jgi:mono/diheme cytochrome c family protein
MCRLVALAAVAALAGVAAADAQELDSIQRGQDLALGVCASCHAVRPGQIQSSAAAAPSFEAVANTPGMTAAALAVWLTAHSHPTMPMIVLSREQGRNVSSYILSLRH